MKGSIYQNSDSSCTKIMNEDHLSVRR